jgi:hypothetical protein
MLNQEDLIEKSGGKKVILPEINLPSYSRQFLIYKKSEQNLQSNFQIDDDLTLNNTIQTIKSTTDF